MRQAEPPQRVCFTLNVRPERTVEYQARHAAVWEEMRTALHTAGWRNYSIFLRGDGLVVGYLECADFASALQAMQSQEVNARWQTEMAPFFQLEPAMAPDAAMVALPEIFHLD